MKIIIGIVTKPFLTSQITGSLWKNLYIKQDFADILSKYNAVSIGIIPNGISLDRINSDDIDLSKEMELTGVEKKHLISQINLCDGLILQGGLSSHKYEVFVAEYAIEHNIPILGICVGFNNIARAVGTDVQQDKELAFKHDIYDAEPHHFVTIQKDGEILCKELAEDTIFVNSIHNMILSASAAYLNKRIIIEAISKNSGMWGIPNVTVEAFSVKDTKFCLAIKWHPELLPNDKVTNIIFKKFIEVCQGFK